MRIDAFERMDHGRSGDVVLRIAAPYQAFAKIAAATGAEALEHEIAVLTWLEGAAGAPRLLWSGEVAGRPALLMQALSGAPLHDLRPPDDIAGAVAAIAAMRALHSLPDCPFDLRLDIKLAQAARRVEEGLVDEADFDAPRAGRSAADVFAELMTLRPDRESLAPTHGDACWPNFIIGADGAAAPIDLGRFGLADPHQDFALFLRSAAYNRPGLDARGLLLDHYPNVTLDDRKIEFYQMLDKFF